MNALSKFGTCSLDGLDAKFDVTQFGRVYARIAYMRMYW